MNKKLLVVLIVSYVVVFAFGRYSNRVVASTSTKTDVVKENENIKSHTVVVTTRTPDGITKITRTTDTQTGITIADTTAQTILTKPSPKINLSALVTAQPFKGSTQPVYGLSISREWIGPVTVGFMGLTNGTVGLTIGVNF